jgi:hypothetical protein
MVIVEKLVEWRLAGETRRKLAPAPLLSTTNPTCLDPDANPGRRGGKLATNSLSYGAAVGYYGILRQVSTMWLMVKCLFIVHRNCIHKDISVFSRVKMQRFQIWRAWKPCRGSSSTFPSVIICVTENISHSTSKMCRGDIMHVPHSWYDWQWYIFL